jgi:hypothetical protein
VSDRFYLGVLLTGVLMLVLLVGLSVGLVIGSFKLWPHQPIQEAWKAGVSLVKYGEIVPDGRIVKAPEYASRERWTAQQPGLVSPGYYAFMGYDQKQKGYRVMLYREDGQQLHSWLLDYPALANSNSDSSSDQAAHAMAVLEDGSIIVGFDFGSFMVRLDSCSQPLWKKDGTFHHSLARADDGSFWTWRGLNNSSIGHFHYLHRFDADTGATLQEIGLVEDVIQPLDGQAQVFAVRPDARFKRNRGGAMEWDIFHPNDLEPLSADMAGAFPMFKAGDLLVSLRNIHLVAVLDGQSGALKWYRHGPWLFQHDPDFMPNGRISVYSNNSKRARSEVIHIDPASGQFSNPLVGGNARFYSTWMGKHQYLPNGNVLIIVPGEGRAIVADPGGDLVLEFNNVSAPGADTNEHIANGVWLPPGYFDQEPACLN